MQPTAGAASACVGSLCSPQLLDEFGEGCSSPAEGIAWKDGNGKEFVWGRELNPDFRHGQPAKVRRRRYCGTREWRVGRRGARFAEVCAKPQPRCRSPKS